MIIKTITVPFFIILALYIMYNIGFITLGNKKAILFIGKASNSKRFWKATFKACTGNLKRIILIKEPQEFTFSLDCKINSGEIKIVLKNSYKKEIFVLTPDSTETTVTLNTGKYYLTVELYKAYGSYELIWK